MSRFEFHPVTREPFLQEPRPRGQAQPTQRFTSAGGPASTPDSNQQGEANISEPPSGSDATSVDDSHQQERVREERGNRGPDEEPGFGQGA